MSLMLVTTLSPCRVWGEGVEKSAFKDMFLFLPIQVFVIFFNYQLH